MIKGFSFGSKGAYRDEDLEEDVEEEIPESDDQYQYGEEKQVEELGEGDE